MADRSASGPATGPGGPERVGGRRRHVPSAGCPNTRNCSQAGRRPTCEAGEHLCRRWTP